MKPKHVRLLIVSSLLAMLLGIVSIHGKQGKEVAYPDGYRSWTHVKSLVLEPGHPLFESFGGLHHVYVNAKGLDSLKAGRSFPDGSVFAFDLFEVDSGGHAIAEGKRKVLGVMEKDSKAFGSTGGWGFEGFAASTRDRVVKDGGVGCFGCHAQQAKSTDYVFSRWRD